MPIQPSAGSHASSPGVRGAVDGPLVAHVVVVQVAAHVTARDSHSAQECNHHVREVLTHAPSRRQRFVDRRVHVRGLRRVLEGVVDPVLQAAHERQWIDVARQPEFPTEGHQRLGRAREMRRFEEIEESLARAGLVEQRPCGPIAARGDGDVGDKLHHRLGHHREFPVARLHIEVVDDVAFGILVGEHAGTRRGGKLEAQAPLHAFGAGLHPYFHHALAHCRVVAEMSQVVDGVSHSASLIGNGESGVGNRGGQYANVGSEPQTNRPKRHGHHAVNTHPRSEAVGRRLSNRRLPTPDSRLPTAARHAISLSS